MDVLTITWTGDNSYSLLSALNHSLFSVSTALTFLSLISCTAFIMWIVKTAEEKEIINKLPVGEALGIKLTIPLVIGIVSALLIAVFMSTNIYETYSSGNDQEFRNLVSESFQEKNMFIDPIQINSPTKDWSTVELSTSGNKTMGVKCLMHNMEPGKLKEGKEYKFQLICGDSTVVF